MSLIDNSINMFLGAFLAFSDSKPSRTRVSFLVRLKTLVLDIGVLGRLLHKHCTQGVQELFFVNKKPLEGSEWCLSVDGVTSLGSVSRRSWK